MAKSSVGVVIVSHVAEIAQGVSRLVSQVAKDVPVSFVGGTDEGGIGSTYDLVQKAINDNPADVLLAFYDLGSAKMNLELACDMSDKDIRMQTVPLVEGAFAACVLLQAKASLEEVLGELEALQITK